MLDSFRFYTVYKLLLQAIVDGIVLDFLFCLCNILKYTSESDHREVYTNNIVITLFSILLLQHYKSCKIDLCWLVILSNGPYSHIAFKHLWFLSSKKRYLTWRMCLVSFSKIFYDKLQKVSDTTVALQEKENQQPRNYKRETNNIKNVVNKRFSVRVTSNLTALAHTSLIILPNSWKP